MTLLATMMAWAARRVQRSARSTRLVCALRGFRLQREHLEARFVQVASASGRPREREWVDVQFEDEVTLARNRVSGQLHALVGMSVQFSSSQDAFDNPYETEFCEATAVFYLDGQRWMTDGRAVFNLSPLETVYRFQHEMELLDARLSDLRPTPGAQNRARTG